MASSSLYLPEQRDQLTRTRRQTVVYFLGHPATVIMTLITVVATVGALLVTGTFQHPARTAGTDPNPPAVASSSISATTEHSATTPLPTSSALTSPSGGSVSAPTSSSVPPRPAQSPPSPSPTAPVTFPVTLTVGAADPVPVIVKPGTTTGALLAERKLTLGVDDTVTPALKAALTAKAAVVITRISYADSTTSQALPQPADRTVDDPNIDAGKSDVVQRGHPGRQETSLRTKSVNGKAQPAVQTGKRTIVPPAATITHVGTRAVRPPDPPPIQQAPPVDPPQQQPVDPPAQQQPVQPPPVQQPPDPPPVQQAPPVQPPVQPAPPPVQQPVQPPPPPPPPPTANFTISCSTAATVQVTVSGSGPVSLRMSPGGSFSGTGGVSGSAQVAAGGSVSVTWSGSSFRWNGVGGSCHE